MSKVSETFQEKIFSQLVSMFEVLEVIDKKINQLDKINDIIKEKSSFWQNNDIQNAIAAKIIKDICEKIDKCECTEKLFDKLKEKEVLQEPLEKDKKDKPSGLYKYSYPNFDVGNASLGSSGNPNALKWPFGKKK